MERLRYIERSAYWRGQVNRQDLVKVFGLSMAQASADLQRYQELNPGVLMYNLKRKRYEGAREMGPVCHVPRLEEAIGLFLSGGLVAGVWGGSIPRRGDGQVDAVVMPARSAPPLVERRMFLAVTGGKRIRVNYFSVSSAEATWRWIRPRAFAHDGNRWHVRAWCETRSDWRDFTLSRIAEADWPEEEAKPPLPDIDWDTTVTLRVRANPSLAEAQRRAIELDYGMRNGVLEIPVRRAMENYLRARLRLPLRDGARELPVLELEELD